jgi:hypothetical protein
VRVHHGRRHVAVAEQLLDGADVVSPLEQVGGEGVASLMTRHPFVDARRPGRVRDGALHDGFVQVMPPLSSFFVAPSRRRKCPLPPPLTRRRWKLARYTTAALGNRVGVARVVATGGGGPAAAPGDGARPFGDGAARRFVQGMPPSRPSLSRRGLVAGNTNSHRRSLALKETCNWPAESSHRGTEGTELFFKDFSVPFVPRCLCGRSSVPAARMGLSRRLKIG